MPSNLRRCSVVLLPVLLAVVLAPWAGAEGRRGDGPCPGGRPLGGDLGVNQFQCVGGSCMLFRQTDDGYVHDFTVEPRLWEIRHDGPGAGVLEEGDTLVAVDGELITTPEAGRRLADLQPGQAVELRLRRKGEVRTVTVTPVAGCGPRRLVSTSDPDYRGGGKVDHGSPAKGGRG